MALLTVIIFTVFLVTLGLSYFAKITAEQRMVLATRNAFNAMTIADAAVEEIFWRYNYNSFESNPTGNGWTLSGSTASYGNSGAPISFTNGSGSTIGTYYATITNYNTAPVVTVTANYTGGSQSTIGNSAQVKAQIEENLDGYELLWYRRVQ
jgi:Tfp pilus assembly protein PilX